MSYERLASSKKEGPRRLLDLSTRPTDEQLWQLDRLMQQNKLTGAEAVLVEMILAKYPREGDCD